MKYKIEEYFSLIIAIIGIMAIGFFIGWCSFDMHLERQNEINKKCHIEIQRNINVVKIAHVKK